MHQDRANSNKVRRLGNARERVTKERPAEPFSALGSIDRQTSKQNDPYGMICNALSDSLRRLMFYYGASREGVIAEDPSAAMGDICFCGFRPLIHPRETFQPCVESGIRTGEFGDAMSLS